MKNREAVTTNGRAAFYAAMWDDLRQSALDKGWALALHGSLANDMDIMAMPWTKDAAPVWDMIFALKKCFDKPKEIEVSESYMPNNRRVFALSIWADFYLDINIIQNNQAWYFDCWNKSRVMETKVIEATCEEHAILKFEKEFEDYAYDPPYC